jgi:3',5'-cyclic AMP phosphodiesterase CpdA
MIIAQISDTHILARSSDRAEGRSRADDLRRCVADINRQQPDAVVHTGDIVQHGLPEEYEHVREILAPLKAPVYVIPGNRDERGALRAAFSDHSHLPENGDFLHYTVEDYPVRLVALDSTAAGERKGVYCARRQAWLHDVLDSARDKPTILLIHHPPFDIDDHYIGGYRRPQEAEALAAVVSQHSQVERLLCGHVHCPTHRRWAGTFATTMASVAVDVRKGVDTSKVKDRPIYQLHEMSGKAGLVSRARIVTT